jgi:hypothetical protein
LLWGVSTRYYHSRPGLTVEDAAERAIALAQGTGELVELLEHEDRRVIVSPTHVGQVCKEWLNAEMHPGTQ